MIYDLKSQYRCIHFVGIGGIGMSGIARVMFHDGYSISGSDINENRQTQALKTLGIHVDIGHKAEHVEKADVVVVSSAIDSSNVEVQAAYQAKIPVLSRADMLAELMRFKYGIAVSGTHGKTTTTSLIAHILSEAKCDPTYVIGGVVNQHANNAAHGSGEIMVTEADESDASFVKLSPIIAVVTNIDDDHMETYQGEQATQDDFFYQFIQRIPFYGQAVVCGDDSRVNQVIKKVSRAYTTYGLLQTNDVRAEQVEYHPMHSTFCVVRKGHPSLEIQLNLPGKHNILNALAAIAVATLCKIPDVDICHALQTFTGVARRFQVLGDYRYQDKTVTMVDDYGHHPTELCVTIDAARKAFSGRRLVMIFQPHRYSRTQALWDAFVQALSQVDVAIVLDIYPGGEQSIVGINTENLVQDLVQKATNKAYYVPTANIVDFLPSVLEDQDAVLFQGAGSVSRIAVDCVRCFVSALHQGEICDVS